MYICELYNSCVHLDVVKKSEVCVLLSYVDGFTYERSAIMSWLNEGKRTSPVTNLPLMNTILMPNNTLKKLMDTS